MTSVAIHPPFTLHCLGFVFSQISDGSQSVAIHPPFTLHGLGVYFLETPVSANLTDCEFTTLLDALEAGLVIIQERRLPTIRQLRVENRSDKLVFVLPGIMVFGGYQDRVIATAAVLDPAEQTLDLPAFCVEPGRWHPIRGREFYVSRAKEMHYAPRKVRTAALLQKNQLAVWEATASYREQARTSVQAPLYSSSLRDVIEYHDLAKAITDFGQECENALASFANANGLAFVLGDSVVEIDLFGTPQLLRICAPILIQSYARDAIITRQTEKQFSSQVENQILQLALTELTAKHYAAHPAKHNRLYLGSHDDTYDVLLLTYRDQLVFKQILSRL